jgi:hypothetical protein
MNLPSLIKAIPERSPLRLSSSPWQKKTSQKRRRVHIIKQVLGKRRRGERLKGNMVYIQNSGENIHVYETQDEMKPPEMQIVTPAFFAKT